MRAVLEVRNLRVEIPTRRATLVALDGVSLEIGEGEVLGVVGESGAGKSITGNAIVGLLEPPSRISGGEIFLGGKRIDNLPYDKLRKIRGKEIGVIFQDPLTSLNPLYTVGRQLVETISTHLDVTKRQARQRAIEILERVGIPGARDRLDSYPHEFSGGMRQRVVIGLALCANPRLIIADEPTTALDVSIQVQIISLLKSLCREYKTSIMLITHDMGVISRTADRVAVMYAGQIVEVGPVREVLHRARHPYTSGLMNCIPSKSRNASHLHQIEGSMPRLDDIPAGCPFHPRCPHAFQNCQLERPKLLSLGGQVAIACWLYSDEFSGERKAAVNYDPSQIESSAALIQRDSLEKKSSHSRTRVELIQVENVRKGFDVSKPLINRILEGDKKRILYAVNGVSFSIREGDTFSIVGESGCGKSTVARLIVGLHRPTGGRVMFEGASLLDKPSSATASSFRRRMQMIFQDPYASLNPRWQVKNIIAEPIRTLGLARTSAKVHQRVDELLEQVGLDVRDGSKYPHEFSGGQRQRVSIARALSSNPDFIVCDEPTSALDVSVQAQILNLMKGLQQRLGLSFLFISHNLSVIYHVSNYVAVMYLGKLVEVADKETLFSQPQHPYTQMLLGAIPDLDDTEHHSQAVPVRGEVPNPLDPPPGCSFHPRCPFARDRCVRESPTLKRSEAGSTVACHAVEEGWTKGES